TLARHLEADDALAPLRLELGALGRRLGHPAAAVEERSLGLLGRLALRLHLLRGGVIPVRNPLIEKDLDGGLVALKALRLVIGSVRTADLWPLVPIEAEPVEAV